MNCHQFKDILLVEYIDQMLEGDLQKKCDEHVANCSSCRNEVVVMQSFSKNIFNNAKEMKPSSRVWDNITNSIQPKPNWAERLGDFFTLPRLSLAIPAIACLMLFVFLPQHAPISMTKSAQIELVEKMSEDLTFTTDDDLSSGFGSVIEDYFM